MWRVRGWGSRYETDRTWYCPSVSLTTFILNILEKQKKWLWQMSDWNCILYSFLLYIFPASFSFRPLPICCQSFSEMNNCNRDKPRSLLLATPPPPPPGRPLIGSTVSKLASHWTRGPVPGAWLVITGGTRSPEPSPGPISRPKTP